MYRLNKLKTLSFVILALLSTVPINTIRAAQQSELRVETRAVSDLSFKGVSPLATNIDIFDYWITPNQNSIDNGWDPSYGNQGINNGKIFKFLQSSHTTDQFGYFNNGEGKSIPKQGMVQNFLNSDGFPVLNTNFNGGNGGITRNEPLNYLFDKNYNSGKEGFYGATGLLQTDSEGYYYYDSTKNFAQFNKATNDFSLFKSPGVIPDRGQFFPFTRGDQVFREENGSLINIIDPKRDYFSDVINHYFGLTMSTTFVQKDGGTNNGKAVTYSFSGDDDVWVFIDGVLVGDVGGMHAATKLDINFQTGEVRVHGDIDTTYDSRTTIKDAFKTAGINDESRFSGNTFKDETYHTLKFFYLERGNAASNLSLRYNFVLESENKIIKTDEMGKRLQGAEFTLYSADAAYNPGYEVFRRTTDEDGIIPFDTFTIDRLKSISNQFVLRETKTPAGHQKNKDIQLTFDGSGDKQVLKVNNQWNSGAYATSYLMTSISTRAMTCLANSSYPLKDPYTGDLSQGFIFAVVLKKTGPYTWVPVYGSEEKGWTITETYSFDTIKKAFENNPNILSPDRNGLYQQKIALPDDFKKYDIYSGSDPQYSLLYFYSPQNELTEGNLFEVNKNSGFSYRFTSDVLISNIKNKFYVQKVNTDKEPLNGAEFSVYKNEDILIASDGKKSIRAGASPITTNTTRDHLIANGDSINQKGTTEFAIENGTFYVVESKAPDGYVRNEEIIQIVADGAGVYGNAGIEKDGVSVLNGIGFLRSNMKNFANSTGIDQSLSDILVTLQSSSAINGPWNNTSKTSHLQFGAANAITDYGPNDGSNAQLLEVTSGWSKLNVQQCLDHDAGKNLVKQNLGGQDISDLFSKMTVIQVENTKQTNLILKKIVEGSEDDLKKSFTFKFNLSNQLGTAVQDSFTAKLYRNGVDSGVTIKVKDNNDLVLKHNESLKIMGLPTGATYSLKETSISPADNCMVHVKVNDGDEKETMEASGVLMESDTSIVYRNQFKVFGDFTFMKTDENGNPLAGAEFVLYQNVCGNKDGHETTTLQIDASGNLSNSDPYYDHWTKVGVGISDAAGHILFTDLDSTTEYRLIETKAPTGYVRPLGQWKLSYQEAKKCFEVSGSIGRPPAFKIEGGTYSVPNYKPADIPFAGSDGIKPNVLFGSMFMAIGSVSFCWKRRTLGKEKREG